MLQVAFMQECLYIFSIQLMESILKNLSLLQIVFPAERGDVEK
jgi:hypothetical protein